MHVHESAELRIIQRLKTSQNTVRFCLFSRLNGYFLHNNTLAIILHVYIMILTRVESIFKLVICDNYTINIIFSSKYRWGSNFRSILLQNIRTKTSLDQFCIRCIRIDRLLWSSVRVRNELSTNHKRDIKTQGEGRWTRQGWIYPMFDVIRHIFIIPPQNQRNSKGEKLSSVMWLLAGR